MNIDLGNSRILHDLKDAVFITILKDDLATILDSDKLYRHADDVKYDKKLIKAYKRILDYYGANDE